MMRKRTFFVGSIGNIDSPDKRTSELYLAIMRALEEKEVAFKRTRFWNLNKNQRAPDASQQVRKRYADESIKLTHATIVSLTFT